jgi:hypothetical protein
VLAERGGEPRVAGEVGRPTELGEGLLLDRVGVGEVLRELFVDRALGHLVLLAGAYGSDPNYPRPHARQRERRPILFPQIAQTRLVALGSVM